MEEQQPAPLATTPDRTKCPNGHASPETVKGSPPGGFELEDPVAMTPMMTHTEPKIGSHMAFMPTQKRARVFCHICGEVFWVTLPVPN